MKEEAKSNPFKQSIVMQQTKEWKNLQALNDLLWELKDKEAKEG